MPTKTKLLLSLALLASAFGAGLWTASKGSLPSGTVKEKVVYVDRVVAKEVIVNRDVATNIKSTETRPDGTKIETETTTADKTVSKERVDETTKSRQVTKDVSTQSKYSLGVSYQRDAIFSPQGVYGAEVGKRLWNSPFWAIVGFNTKREITLGARFEW